MKNLELKKYLQNQITQSPHRLEGYTKDVNGKELPNRDIYSELKKYVNDFCQKRTEPRIIIMPGLRGVGKTTLLAQLFLNLPRKNILKLYLSIDEVIKRFDVNLWETIEIYEELIGKHIENLDKPLFLFLDEIHCDDKWDSFLKSIYDKSKKIFIFCTGSAALLLRKKNKDDLARRAFFVDIDPINFAEYLKLKYQKNPIKGLSKEIRNTIWQSNSAQELFSKIKTQEKKINDYWINIDRLEIDNYIKLGTLPFTLKSENQQLSLDYIGQMLNKIIYSDIPQFSKFETTTLNKIEKILYLISDSLNVSITHLSGVLGTKKETLSLILKALEDAGVLIKIPPYGSHNKQIKKPSKYLFASPSLRFFFLDSINSTKIFDTYKGSLLEDMVGMYLNRILPKYGASSLTYDASKRGADFIIRTINQKNVIEVGFGQKGTRQAQNTLKKIKGDYGIIISNADLDLKDNIIKMPLRYFLLA